MRRFLLLAAAVLLTGSSALGDTVLYDGSQGNAPQDQGWLSYAGFGTSYAVGSGGVAFDSTSDPADQGGFSNYEMFSSTPVNGSFPALARAAGFTIELDLGLFAESHSSNDRAGFSVIVLGDDAKGIELGFWTDSIWAQDDDPLFTQAESVSYDTTAELVRYAITIQGDTYSLSAAGSEILTGDVRDYSSWGAPYGVANFLFLGDNTTSAAGAAGLGYVAVVPEPGTLAALAAGAGLVLLRRRRAMAA